MCLGHDLHFTQQGTQAFLFRSARKKIHNFANGRQVLFRKSDGLFPLASLVPALLTVSIRESPKERFCKTPGAPKRPKKTFPPLFHRPRFLKRYDLRRTEDELRQVRKVKVLRGFSGYLIRHENHDWSTNPP